MHTAEMAWLAREYVGGRRQVEIARQLGFAPAVVCRAIRRFCEEWAQADHVRFGARHAVARIAIDNYFRATGGRLKRPSRLGRDYDDPYWKARLEHCWMLRAEGLTHREIGDRLDVHTTRAQQMTIEFGEHVQEATRKMRVRWE